MGSDRARVSYDPNQQYRSVVMQQGRVTLEADWNEAQQISSEELRRETLDIVGPCGTPDDGYKVVLHNPPSNHPFDFYVRDGIMYVGGLRAELLDSVPYSNQPDWLDYGPEDPDWVSLSTLAQHPPTDEFIYLLLREQEVSAVEDPDLKDVALGGPDTAQRSRLLQRFVRLHTNGTTCTAGLQSAETKWRSEGLWFHPDDMRLYSQGTLQVSFSGQAQTDPCQPVAQGGYVAPDNQLIRVQISGIDPLTGHPKFLWGFDDASFLYRIDVDPNNSQNLIFQSAPVDAGHQPVSGQAVEILRSAAELKNGGFVAALSGFVVTLDKNYLPDSQSVTLPAGVTLPLDYLTSRMSPPPQLFLRVWEQEVVFSPGTAMSLGNTGVQITIDAPKGTSFHLGDYWLFAVRPATPQAVYPERYQQAPQRPDGPRLWACPLGVIGWNQEIGTLVADCRNPFDNLVDLSKRQEGCCTITVRPQDLATTSLQQILDQAASPTMFVQAANPGAPGNNISIQVTNLQLNQTPPTFDLVVNETDTYLGLSTSDQFTGIEAVIGDEEGGPNDGLAHVLVGSVRTKLTPLDNQTVTFNGGQANTSAQANIMDTTNLQVVFTLQARNPGADGNITRATISNVSGTNFDLIVTWQKKATGLTMAGLQSAIQGMGYLIVADFKESNSPPAEGVTWLTGGADADPNTQTSAATAQAAVFGNPARVCLRAGSYPLIGPLVLNWKHSNLTIEGCGGVTLWAKTPENEKDFAQGMIHIVGANNLTLRGLTFSMPRVNLYRVGLNLAGLSQASLGTIGDSTLVSLDSSIGLTVMGVSGLTVEDCQFRFPALQLNEMLFGVAIFAGADCSDMTVQGNMFAGPDALKAVKVSGAVPAVIMAAGYMQADSLQVLSLNSAGATAGGTLVPSTLDNIRISGNSFENLTFPVFILTGLGAATLQGNVVRSCMSGFTILPLISTVAAANQAVANDIRTQILQEPTAQRMASIAVAFPRPSSFVPSRQIVVGPALKVTSPPASGGLKFTRIPTSITRVPLNLGVVTNLSLRTRAAVLPGATAPGATAPPAAAPAPPSPPPAPPAAAPAPPSPPPAPAGPAVLKISTLSPLSLRVAEVMSNLSAESFIFVRLQRNLAFSVSMSSNDIEASLNGKNSLWALTISDLGAIVQSLGGSPGLNTTAFGTLTLTGNNFRSSGLRLIGTTVSLMVDYCAVAGNVILNQSGDGSSLAISVLNANKVNIARAAITGNVLLGGTILPPRVPASLPDWTTYNLAI
jgi:hypothetical protein